MSDYINFEAEAEFIEDNEVSDFSDNGSEDLFINDNDQNVNTDVSFYRGFKNVENDIEQVLKESYEESLEDLDNCNEISNLCYGSEGEKLKIDDFKNFEVDIEKFEETLFLRVDVEVQKIHNQICYTILYALRYDKDKSMDECHITELQKLLIATLLIIFSINLNLLSICKNLKICATRLIAFYLSLVIFYKFLNCKTIIAD